MNIIPDLRLTEYEITLEHCYVLVAKLEEAFTGDEVENDFFGIANDLNPQNMQEFFYGSFTPEAFHQLFRTEIGKGVLVGAYAGLLLKQMEEDLAGVLEDEA